MNNILILGSEGYLGSVLVPFLVKKGYLVTGVDKCFFGRNNKKNRKKYNLIKKDYRKLKTNFFKKFYFIIDLVNISNDPASELNPEFTNKTNYLNKLKMLRKINKCDNLKRYIYISSCSVYGNNSDTITEKTRPSPISLYSKLCLKYEKQLKKNKKFDYTILRLGTLYGWSPRMRYDLAINKILKDMIFLKKIEILGGLQQRFFCYNEFACKVIYKVMKNNKKTFINKIFNIGVFNSNIVTLTKKIINLTKYKNFIVSHEKHNIDKRSYKVSTNSSKKFVNRKFKFESYINRSIINCFRRIKSDKKPFESRKITLNVYKKYLIKKKIYDSFL